MILLPVFLVLVVVAVVGWVLWQRPKPVFARARGNPMNCCCDGTETLCYPWATDGCAAVCAAQGGTVWANPDHLDCDQVCS